VSTASYGWHRTDNNCSASWQDSKFRSNYAISLKGENNSMAVLWAEGSWNNMKGSVDILMVKYGDKQAGIIVRDA